jgi:hypothetical protein
MLRAHERSPAARSGIEATRSARLSPVQARMLTLQRTAGNRAAGRLARPSAPVRTLARYEAGEHIQFGTSGGTVTIGGLRIDERYLIALRDFYESPGALLSARREESRSSSR